MQYAMMAQAQQEAELEEEGSDHDVDNQPNTPKQSKRRLRKE